MSEKKSHDCFLSFFSRRNNVIVYPEVRVQVQTIRELLLAKNVKTMSALDVQGNLEFGIVDAIDTSKKVIIFLTKNYMIEVNNRETIMQQEFTYALDKLGFKNTIIVALEEEMQNTQNWERVFRFKLGRFQTTDMSSAQKIEENIDALVEQINN